MSRKGVFISQVVSGMRPKTYKGGQASKVKASVNKLCKSFLKPSN